MIPILFDTFFFLQLYLISIIREKTTKKAAWHAQKYYTCNMSLQKSSKPTFSTFSFIHFFFIFCSKHCHVLSHDRDDNYDIFFLSCFSLSYNQSGCVWIFLRKKWAVLLSFAEWFFFCIVAPGHQRIWYYQRRKKKVVRFYASSYSTQFRSFYTDLGFFV